MPSVGVLAQLSHDVVKEALARPTLFKDESPLSLEFIPARLPHRESQMSFLTQLFRFTIDKPNSMSQRALITGDVGSGKTVLTQRFGLDIVRTAKNRKVNLLYVHVNCRESKGSLFHVLKRVLTRLAPDFPKRGFASEELLHTLMDMLDDKNTHLILALDELESLIRTEGSTPIYNLTRIQEERPGQPMRLSLICILREPEYIEKLDRSTQDTLQRNFVKLEHYQAKQLEAILKDRVELAFKENTVPDDALRLLADVAGSTGDARYAIELLWRAGKYADADQASRVSADYVRKSVGSVYPTLRGDYITALSIHERLFILALSKKLQESGEAYATIGEVEHEYKATCEEYGETPRRHTQLWKYARSLGSIGVIASKVSGEGVRGKTTLLGLATIPAQTMRERLEASMASVQKPRRRPL